MRSCPILKIIAIITLFAFLSQQNANAYPLGTIKQTLFSVENLPIRFKDDSFYLPPELGKVVDQLGDTPSLFLIQDAHGDDDVQQNIENILSFLHQRMPLSAILLEGGVGPLDQGLLKFTPRDEFNVEAAVALRRQAELGGPEVFLLKEKIRLLSPKKNSNNDKDFKSVQAYGVEDGDLFSANVKDFQKVIAKIQTANLHLGRLLRLIRKQASQTFNPELYKIFNEWVHYEEHDKNFSRYLSALTDVGKRILGIDFQDPRNQLDWPMLVRYCEVKRREYGLNAQRAAEEYNRLIDWAKMKRVEAWLVQCLEMRQQKGFDYSIPGLPWRAFWEYFYRQTEAQGFRFEDYPHWSDAEGLRILESEIEAVDLMKEAAHLRDEIFRRLAKNELESEILGQAKNCFMLKKLFNLKLTREEYEEAVKLVSVRTSITAFARQGSGLPSGSGDPYRGADAPLFLPLKAPVNLRDVLRDALAFYEHACDRERAMLRFVREQMSGKDSGRRVLVTGGFHTQPIVRALRMQKISYAVIRPHMARPGEGENKYRASLLGEKTLLDFEQATLRHASWMTAVAEWRRLRLPRNILKNRERFQRAIQREFDRRMYQSESAKEVSSRSETRISKDFRLDLAMVRAFHKLRLQEPADIQILHALERAVVDMDEDFPDAVLNIPASKTPLSLQIDLPFGGLQELFLKIKGDENFQRLLAELLSYQDADSGVLKNPEIVRGLRLSATSPEPGLPPYLDLLASESKLKINAGYYEKQIREIQEEIDRLTGNDPQERRDARMTLAYYAQLGFAAESLSALEAARFRMDPRVFILAKRVIRNADKKARDSRSEMRGIDLRHQKILQELHLEVADSEKGWIAYPPEYEPPVLTYDLFFVSHGRTRNNVLKVLHGRTQNENSRLDTEGMKQAEEGAEIWWRAHGDEFRKHPENYVFFRSPLDRTGETFAVYQKFILAKTGRRIKAVVDPNLIEIDFGIWDGLSLEQVKQKYGFEEWQRAAAYRQSHSWITSSQGGESYSDMMKRSRDWMNGHNRSLRGKKVFVFGHGTFHMAAETVLRTSRVVIDGGVIRWQGYHPVRGIPVPVYAKHRSEMRERTGTEPVMMWGQDIRPDPRVRDYLEKLAKKLQTAQRAKIFRDLGRKRGEPLSDKQLFDMAWLEWSLKDPLNAWFDPETQEARVDEIMIEYKQARDRVFLPPEKIASLINAASVLTSEAQEAVRQILEKVRRPDWNEHELGGWVEKLNRQTAPRGYVIGYDNDYEHKTAAAWETFSVRSVEAFLPQQIEGQVFHVWLSYAYRETGSSHYGTQVSIREITEASKEIYQLVMRGKTADGPGQEWFSRQWPRLGNLSEEKAIQTIAWDVFEMVLEEEVRHRYHQILRRQGSMKEIEAVGRDAEEERLAKLGVLGFTAVPFAVGGAVIRRAMAYWDAMFDELVQGINLFANFGSLLAVAGVAARFDDANARNFLARIAPYQNQFGEIEISVLDHPEAVRDFKFDFSGWLHAFRRAGVRLIQRAAREIYLARTGVPPNVGSSAGIPKQVETLKQAGLVFTENGFAYRPRSEMRDLDLPVPETDEALQELLRETLRPILRALLSHSGEDLEARQEIVRRMAGRLESIIGRFVDPVLRADAQRDILDVLDIEAALAYPEDHLLDTQSLDEIQRAVRRMRITRPEGVGQAVSVWEVPLLTYAYGREDLIIRNGQNDAVHIRASSFDDLKRKAQIHVTAPGLNRHIREEFESLVHRLAPNTRRLRPVGPEVSAPFAPFLLPGQSLVIGDDRELRHNILITVLKIDFEPDKPPVVRLKIQAASGAELYRQSISGQEFKIQTKRSSRSEVRTNTRKPLVEKSVENLIRDVVPERQKIIEKIRAWEPAAIAVMGGARVPSGHSYYKLGVKLGKELYRHRIPPRTGAGPGLMEAPLMGYQKARSRRQLLNIGFSLLSVVSAIGIFFYGMPLAAILGLPPGIFAVVSFILAFFIPYLILRTSWIRPTQGVRINFSWEQLTTPMAEKVEFFERFLTRKIALHENTLGNIYLPGGFGTLDELFEFWRRGRPVALLGRDFWQPILERFAAMIDASGDSAALPFLTDDPAEAVEYILKFRQTKPPHRTGDDELAHLNREINSGLSALTAMRRAVVMVGEPQGGSPELEAVRKFAALSAALDMTDIRVASSGVLYEELRPQHKRDKKAVRLQAVLHDASPDGQLRRHLEARGDFKFLKKGQLLAINNRSNHQLMTAFNGYAYIFVPGAFRETMNHLFDILVLMQTQKVRKRPVILIGKKYWEPLLQVLRKQMLERPDGVRFVSADDFSLLRVVDAEDPAEMAETLRFLEENILFQRFEESVEAVGYWNRDTDFDFDGFYGGLNSGHSNIPLQEPQYVERARGILARHGYDPRPYRYQDRVYHKRMPQAVAEAAQAVIHQLEVPVRKAKTGRPRWPVLIKPLETLASRQSLVEADLRLLGIRLKRLPVSVLDPASVPGWEALRDYLEEAPREARSEMRMSEEETDGEEILLDGENAFAGELARKAQFYAEHYQNYQRAKRGTLHAFFEFIQQLHIEMLAAGRDPYASQSKRQEKAAMFLAYLEELLHANGVLGTFSRDAWYRAKLLHVLTSAYRNPVFFDERGNGRDRILKIMGLFDGSTVLRFVAHEMEAVMMGRGQPVPGGVSAFVETIQDFCSRSNYPMVYFRDRISSLIDRYEDPVAWQRGHDKIPAPRRDLPGLSEARRDIVGGHLVEYAKILRSLDPEDRYGFVGPLLVKMTSRKMPWWLRDQAVQQLMRYRVNGWDELGRILAANYSPPHEAASFAQDEDFAKALVRRLKEEDSNPYHDPGGIFMGLNAMALLGVRDVSREEREYLSARLLRFLSSRWAELYSSFDELTEAVARPEDVNALLALTRSHAPHIRRTALAGLRSLMPQLDDGALRQVRDLAFEHLANPQLYSQDWILTTLVALSKAGKLSPEGHEPDFIEGINRWILGHGARWYAFEGDRLRVIRDLDPDFAGKYYRKGSWQERRRILKIITDWPEMKPASWDLTQELHERLLPEIEALFSKEESRLDSSVEEHATDTLRLMLQLAGSQTPEAAVGPGSYQRHLELLTQVIVDLEDKVAEIFDENPFPEPREVYDRVKQLYQMRAAELSGAERAAVQTALVRLLWDMTTVRTIRRKAYSLGLLAHESDFQFSARAGDIDAKDAAEGHTKRRDFIRDILEFLPQSFMILFGPASFHVVLDHGSYSRLHKLNRYGFSWEVEKLSGSAARLADSEGLGFHQTAGVYYGGLGFRFQGAYYPSIRSFENKKFSLPIFKHEESHLRFHRDGYSDFIRLRMSQDGRSLRDDIDSLEADLIRRGVKMPDLRKYLYDIMTSFLHLLHNEIRARYASGIGILPEHDFRAWYGFYLDNFIKAGLRGEIYDWLPYPEIAETVAVRLRSGEFRERIKAVIADINEIKRRKTLEMKPSSDENIFRRNHWLEIYITMFFLTHPQVLRKAAERNRESGRPETMPRSEVRNEEAGSEAPLVAAGEKTAQGTLYERDQAERKAFISLLEILDANSWIRQEPGYTHKTDLGFDEYPVSGGLPDAMTVQMWTDEIFKQKKKYLLGEVITRSIEEGKLEDMRRDHPGDEARMYDFLERLGFAIDTTSVAWEKPLPDRESGKLFPVRQHFQLPLWAKGFEDLTPAEAGIFYAWATGDMRVFFGRPVKNSVNPMDAMHFFSFWSPQDPVYWVIFMMNEVKYHFSGEWERFQETESWKMAPEVKRREWFSRYYEYLEAFDSFENKIRKMLGLDPLLMSQTVTVHAEIPVRDVYEIKLSMGTSAHRTYLFKIRDHDLVQVTPSGRTLPHRLPFYHATPIMLSGYVPSDGEGEVLYDDGGHVMVSRRMIRGVDTFVVGAGFRGCQVNVLTRIPSGGRSEIRNEAQEARAHTLTAPEKRGVIAVARQMTGNIYDSAYAASMAAENLVDFFDPEDASADFVLSAGEKTKLVSDYAKLFDLGARAVLPAQAVLLLPEAVRREYVGLVLAGMPREPAHTHLEIYLAGEGARPLKKEFYTYEIFRHHPAAAQFFKVDLQNENVVGRRLKGRPVSVSWMRPPSVDEKIDGQIPAFLIEAGRLGNHKKLSLADQLRYLTRLTQLQLLAAIELQNQLPEVSSPERMRTIRGFLGKIGIDYEEVQGFVRPTVQAMLSEALTQYLSAYQAAKTSA